MSPLRDFYDTKPHPWGTKPTHVVRDTLTLLKPGSVLDLGGGDGKNARFLARQGFSVTNVDNNAEALVTCDHLAKKDGSTLETLQKDLATFSIEHEYSNVLMIFVLHFLKRDDALRIIRESQEKTEIGGLNIIAAFTQQGELLSTDREELFWAAPKELLTLYDSWDLLRYKKMNGGTIAGVPHEREILVARKCV